MVGEATKLQRARAAFVAQWGVLGSSWGVNRSVAQVHALLAQAWDALGRPDNAAAHHAWVARAWEHGDAQYAQQAEAARRHARLGP